MKIPVFEAQGTFTALVTPFNKDGSVDYPAFESLIKNQISGGITGIAINSTTGEAPTLSESEKSELLTTAVKLAKGRIPIIAGTGSYDTKKTIDLTNKAKELGASAALIVTPYYNKPTQTQLYEHYKTIVKNTELPIILYNVPGRTGLNMSPDTQLRLAKDFSRIVATKEASGNMDQIMTIIRNAPKGFSVISGDDAITLPLIACGGKGVISVLTNYMTKEMSDLVKFALKGQYAKALEIHNKLFELMNLNFIESNPVPAKAAMSLLGLCNEYVRQPLCSITAPNRKIMAEGLKRASLM
jgi:4-hydroxy-tetrahydrodipicolinate synthase